jgi:hypothetical protein
VNTAFLGLLSSTGDSNFSTLNGFSNFSPRLLFQEGPQIGLKFSNERCGAFCLQDETRKESRARAQDC